MYKVIARKSLIAAYINFHLKQKTILKNAHECVWGGSGEGGLSLWLKSIISLQDIGKVFLS